MSPSHAAATTLCWLLAACAGGGADTAGSGSAAPGRVSVSPSQLDMGDLALGEHLSANLTITNLGDGPLALYDVQLADDRLRILWSLSGPTSATLQPGASSALVVSFSPVSLDAPSTSLKVLTDDPDSPIVTVPLAAESHGTPDLRLDALSVDVGEVAVGAAASALVRIANDGTADLQITATALESLDGAWSVVVDPTGSPVPPRTESGAAILEFRPTAAGLSTATLTLSTSDPDQASASVQLIGTGT